MGFLNYRSPAAQGVTTAEDYVVAVQLLAVSQSRILTCGVVCRLPPQSEAHRAVHRPQPIRR